MSLIVVYTLRCKMAPLAECVKSNIMSIKKL